MAMLAQAVMKILGPNQNDKGKCKLDVSSTEETREQNMQMTN